jgi:hypothetical protein
VTVNSWGCVCTDAVCEVVPLHEHQREIERLRAENAELKASVRLLTASIRATDQPAAAHPYKCGGRDCGYGYQTGDWICICGERRTADQQSVTERLEAAVVDFMGTDTLHLHTADQQDVCMSSVHHRFAGIRVVDEPDQQKVSMQDAPQPVDGTGKQSMQACTTEKQTLVQPAAGAACPACHGTGTEVVVDVSNLSEPFHHVVFCRACGGMRTADKSSGG